MDDASNLMVMLGVRETLEAEIKDRKAALDEINKSILAVAKPHAEAAYTREGKNDGTVSFAIGSRVFKSVISKTVKYDTEKLQSIAGSIPWADAEKLFKIEFDVPERAFNAVTDADLKKRLTEARTVKYGAPKITEA